MSQLGPEALRQFLEDRFNSWIRCENELPPCNGTYLITNDPVHESDVAPCFYDGYGFKYLGPYVEPEYWKPIPPMIKKYGKQVKQ